MQFFDLSNQLFGRGLQANLTLNAVNHSLSSNHSLTGLQSNQTDTGFFGSLSVQSLNIFDDVVDSISDGAKTAGNAIADGASDTLKFA